MKKILTVAVAAFTLLSSCNNLQRATTENTQQLSDEQLMDQVQKDALKYFWDFAEPNSLMGRERYHEDFYPKNDAHVIT
ncbi:MAG: glucoamylase family protein, partial [Kaistella sp.]